MTIEINKNKFEKNHRYREKKAVNNGLANESQRKYENNFTWIKTR